MRALIFTLLLTQLLSCASQKTQETEMDGMTFRMTEDGVIELVDRADEEVKKVHASVAPTFIYDDEEKIEEVIEETEVVAEDVVSEEEIKKGVVPQEEAKKVIVTKAEHEESVDTSGEEFISYKIEKNDSLMLIAQKLYNDYSRWSEIYKLNREVIKNSEVLIAGKTLRVKDPKQSPSQREGSPYLIKDKNDTLQKISLKLYGSMRYWYHLWHQNRELITDPDKIYLGFTIYYLPKDVVEKNRREYISDYIWHFQSL